MVCGGGRVLSFDGKVRIERWKFLFAMSASLSHGCLQLPSRIGGQVLLVLS